MTAWTASLCVTQVEGSARSTRPGCWVLWSGVLGSHVQASSSEYPLWTWEGSLVPGQGRWGRGGLTGHLGGIDRWPLACSHLPTTPPAWPCVAVTYTWCEPVVSK